MKIWLSNLTTAHHRIIAKYLQRRGWVVFYLEKKHRKCNDVCWLKLYENQNN